MWRSFINGWKSSRSLFIRNLIIGTIINFLFLKRCSIVFNADSILAISYLNLDYSSFTKLGDGNAILVFSRTSTLWNKLYATIQITIVLGLVNIKRGWHYRSLLVLFHNHKYLRKITYLILLKLISIAFKEDSMLANIPNNICVWFVEYQ